MANYQGKTPLTPADIKGSELYGVLIQARGESLPLSDDAIGQKIRAAEDFYERNLQTFFNLRRVASDPARRGLVKGQFPPFVSDYTNDYDVAEPAYDYEQDLFLPNRWAWMDLNYRPVQSVTEMFIQFPGSTSPFIIPPDWILLDQKKGRIQILPLKGPAVAAFLTANVNVTILVGANQTVPQILYVDYVAGIGTKDDELGLDGDSNDLLEGVRLMTVLLLFGILSIIRTAGIGSASLSEDGLSRSQSFLQGKYGPYGPMIELAMQNEKEIRRTWKDQEHGVLMGVA